MFQFDSVEGTDGVGFDRELPHRKIDVVGQARLYRCDATLLLSTVALVEDESVFVLDLIWISRNYEHGNGTIHARTRTAQTYWETN